MGGLLAFLILVAVAVFTGTRPRPHKKPWYRTWH